MKIQINKTYYEAVHGKMPHQSKKLDWTFQPPRRTRPWKFANCTYKQALAKLRRQAEKSVGSGEYVLLP